MPLLWKILATQSRILRIGFFHWIVICDCLQVKNIYSKKTENHILQKGFLNIFNYYFLKLILFSVPFINLFILHHKKPRVLPLRMQTTAWFLFYLCFLSERKENSPSVTVTRTVSPSSTLPARISSERRSSMRFCIILLSGRAPYISL